MNLNILIVEDQDSKKNAIRDYIRSVESNVHFVFSDCQVDALRNLEKTKFDLMLLDMCLPLRKGNELDNMGGEKILDEIDVNDEYYRPTMIVALTQYEELQEDIRLKFPELGAIKYSIDNIDWQLGIERAVKSCLRSKKTKRTIVYCEHKNDKLYNQIGLDHLEFRGLTGGSRKVYEYAKFDSGCFAIRDKDYLTRNEVKWLTESKFDNYLILEYYCFENYLFHPDNLEEYFTDQGMDFDKNAYVAEILRQKNEKFLDIVQGLEMSRNGYFDFTDNERTNMDERPEIVSCLRSDVFEDYYPYFDMKGSNKNKGFDRKFLSDKNIDKEKLVKTSWFNEKMRCVFSKAID